MSATLSADVSRMIDSDVHLNIVEIRKPELDARLVAENISQQLERRVAFRRANGLIYDEPSVESVPVCIIDRVEYVARKVL